MLICSEKTLKNFKNSGFSGLGRKSEIKTEIYPVKVGEICGNICANVH
jgi:hypothetical protein